MTVEKAIEILSDVGDINRCCAEDAEALDMAIKALEQQPKTGHWIMTGAYYNGAYDYISYVECSRCHEDSLEAGDYCPNCGVKMEEGEE